MKQLNLPKSSRIKNGFYDEDKMELLLVFNNNRIYKYYNVSKEVVIKFQKSKSIGKAFNDLIGKNFKYEEVWSI